jgi:hypothetical protein
MFPESTGSVLLWFSLNPLTYAATLVMIASFLHEVINLFSIVKSKGLPLRTLLKKKSTCCGKMIKLYLVKSLITSSAFACRMHDL